MCLCWPARSRVVCCWLRWAGGWAREVPQDRRRLIAAPACVVRRLEQTAARATAQRLKRGRAEVTPEDAFRDAGIVLPPGAMLQVRWSARVKSARVKSAAKERQCLVPRACVILSCASSRARLSRSRASLSRARASFSIFDGCVRARGSSVPTTRHARGTARSASARSSRVSSRGRSTRRATR